MRRYGQLTGRGQQDQTGPSARDWCCPGDLVPPYWNLPSHQESPAISKRKPPSQRPERKLDETALAIARLREDAKPDKSSRPDRLASDDLKVKRGLAQNVTGHPKAVGGAPSASTKRPKTFGS